MSAIFPKVTCESKDPQVVESMVDTDLDRFAQFMETELGGGLLDIERVAIKTYLAWKLERFHK